MTVFYIIIYSLPGVKLSKLGSDFNNLTVELNGAGAGIRTHEGTKPLLYESRPIDHYGTPASKLVLRAGFEPAMISLLTRQVLSPLSHRST